MLKTQARVFNTQMDFRRKKNRVPYPKTSTKITFPCTVKGFMSSSYDMYGTSTVEKQVIMDYNQMFPYITPHLPSDQRKRDDFTDWLAEPGQMLGFAGLFVYTLPGDRVSYY